MRAARIAFALAVGLGFLAPREAGADPNPHWRPTLAARHVERVPSFAFHGFADGTTATTIRIGRSSFTTFSHGLSATSTSVGSTTFTRFSDGRSATTLQVGSAAFTTFVGGTPVTTSQVGRSTFTGACPQLSAPRARLGSAFRFTSPGSGVAPMPRPAW